MDSLLKRGLSGSGAAVALKVCRALDLQLEDLLPVLSHSPKDPEKTASRKTEPSLGGEQPLAGELPQGRGSPLEPGSHPGGASAVPAPHRRRLGQRGAGYHPPPAAVLQAMVELLSAEFH